MYPDMNINAFWLTQHLRFNEKFVPPKTLESVLSRSIMTSSFLTWHPNAIFL